MGELRRGKWFLRARLGGWGTIRGCGEGTLDIFSLFPFFVSCSRASGPFLAQF